MNEAIVITAMKQALEALELYQSKSSVQMFDEAVTALRQALETEKQEPVCWTVADGWVYPDDTERVDDGVWHQPEQQKPPLTDEQIEELLPEADGTAEEVKRKVEYRPGLWADEVGIDDAWSKPLVIEIIRAVEKHHGIGGKA